MFDSGSQRIYVNEHLKQILNMKTLRIEKLILKIFGNYKSSANLFNVVEIKLNGMKKDFVIEALVVPQICSPITNQIVIQVSQNYPQLKNLRLADSFDEQLNQIVTRVSQNYPHSKNLRLADSFDEQLMNIDILRGRDFYHTFFTDEIIRE